jgi:hypothetical protein
MALIFDQRRDAYRTSSNPPTAEIGYKAAGIADGATVKALALSLTPAIVAVTEGILYRQDIRVQEQGFCLFHVDVQYGQSNRETGNLSFRFSTTGGSFHITHSRETVAKYPNTAIDHKQAIGVRKNGTEQEIDGADVIIPSLKLSYTFRHPQGVVNEAHARTLASITGCVNDSTFRGFSAGEMLFLGAEGSDGTNAEAEVTYHFAAESNLQNLVIGTIEDIQKDGHDLLWVQWKDAPVGGKPTKAPLAVYIERIYRRVNLAAILGWGA